MKTTIRTNHIELTEAIRNYIEEKIGTLDRFLHEKEAVLADARIEVGKPSQHHHTGPVFEAECNIHIGDTLLRATTNDADLYAAIDKLKDEVEAQMRKHKEKHLAERREARE